MKKFTKDTKLEEVLKPEYFSVMAKYSVPCTGCSMARMEAGVITLGQIAEGYGLDLEGMLKELNEIDVDKGKTVKETSAEK